MAPKKHDPMEDPPTTSSDEDDSSSGTSSDEDPMPPPKPASKKPDTGPNASQPTESGSSSENTSTEDSDSDDESTAKKPETVKPLATKSINGKLNPAAVPSASNTKKRPNEGADAKVDNKKGKTVDDGEPKTEDTKKQLFQRRFSEEDEIALLEGIHDYTVNRGMDAFSDVDGFFEYMKNVLTCEANKSQVNEKIKRMRKKYLNQSLRKGKKGDDPTFSRPHDQKSFDLSKKIWFGGEASTPKKPAQKTNPKSNGKAILKVEAVPKVEVAPKQESSGIDNLIKLIRDGDKEFKDSLMKSKPEAADPTTTAELDERWKALRIAKLRLFIEETKLTLKQAELVLDAALTD